MAHVTVDDDLPVGLAAAEPLGDTTRPANESVFTVVLAGAANLAIAAAKLVAGLISGSAAMVSEAAHSLADTITEAFLFVALRRGVRPCLLYTSPSPRDQRGPRMPSSA